MHVKGWYLIKIQPGDLGPIVLTLGKLAIFSPSVWGPGRSVQACNGNVLVPSETRGCFNIGFPSVIHLKTQILSIHNIHFSCPIILKFCTEHGSITAMLCAKFQNDWATVKYVMGKKFSRDLNLWWVSEGYSTLQQSTCRLVCTNKLMPTSPCEQTQMKSNPQWDFLYNLLQVITLLLDNHKKHHDNKVV